MGQLITEDSEKAQCTFSASAVLRHRVPPLKKKIAKQGKKLQQKRGQNQSHTPGRVHGAGEA